MRVGYMLIGIASGMALSFSNPAICGIFNDTGQGQRRPMGENPVFAPPMDEPPLPWFQYHKDSLGRDTYISDACLRETDKNIVGQCLGIEISRHENEIRWHDVSERANKAEMEVLLKNRELDNLQKKYSDLKRSFDIIKGDNEILANDVKYWKSFNLNKRAEVSNPDNHLKNIKNAKIQIAHFRSVIDREHKIGSISGYENSSMLYQAGSMIEYYTREINSEYSLYRKYGGKLSLEAIVAQK